MTNVVSALTARTQFGQIIKRATQKNERFVVGRRGEPSVVIMSMKDYMNTFAPAPQELRAMQATAKRTGANKLTPRPDQQNCGGSPKRAEAFRDLSAVPNDPLGFGYQYPGVCQRQRQGA